MEGSGTDRSDDQKGIRLMKHVPGTNFKKPRKKKKKQKPIRESARMRYERQLRKDILAGFENLGNSGWCENEIEDENGKHLCMKSFGIALAHRMTKQHFKGLFKSDLSAFIAEYTICARLCGGCHDVLDNGIKTGDKEPSEIMFEKVTYMHENREEIYSRYGIY